MTPCYQMQLKQNFSNSLCIFILPLLKRFVKLHADKLSIHKACWRKPTNQIKNIIFGGGECRETVTTWTCIWHLALSTLRNTNISCLIRVLIYCIIMYSFLLLTVWCNIHSLVHLNEVSYLPMYGKIPQKFLWIESKSLLNISTTGIPGSLFHISK